MRSYTKPQVEVLGSLHELTLLPPPYPGKMYTSKGDGEQYVNHKGKVFPEHS